MRLHYFVISNDDSSKNMSSNNLNNKKKTHHLRFLQIFGIRFNGTFFGYRFNGTFFGFRFIATSAYSTSTVSNTSCETGSNIPYSCPMVIDLGLMVLKRVFCSSICSLSFNNVSISLRVCSTFVFPENGSPTNMKLKQG